jgi:hypothetical protein
MIVGVPLLLVMPFSGLSAISREKTANTLELIFLTRLTARRIVFGKWVAIIAQTLLLLSAILPYAVLRYYLGGVDIASELTDLAWMLAGSALLTSFTVGISPVMGRLGRVLMPVGMLIALQIFGVITAVTASPVVRGGRDGWQFYTVLALQSIFLMLLMLEVGSEKIAPAAENHSTPKRLVALGSTLTAILYSYTPGAQWRMWLAGLFIAGPVLIGSVCEPVREVPSVYRPFLRRGFVGRAFGRFFYPGWPGGVFFSLLLLAAAGFRVYQIEIVRIPASGMMDENTLLRIIALAVVGAFLMPVAFLQLLRVKIPFPAVFYFVFHGLLGLLALIGVLATQFGSNHRPYSPPASGAEHVIACVPTCTLILFSRIREWSPGQISDVLGGVTFVTVCTILILLVRMWPAWRKIAALEKTAAGFAPAASPPDAARPAAAA